MDINILTLCDSAQDYNGKMVITGTFDTISSYEFPAIHREMAVAIKVSYGKDESIVSTSSISIKKADEDIFLMPHTQLPPISNNFIVKLNDVVIHKPGEYYVELKVGDTTKRIPLHILQVEK